MISFLSRKLRAFLFIILVLVAAAFIFIDVPTSGLTGGNQIGEIRGESISQSDFQKYYRETQLTFTMRTGQMVPQYSGMAEMLERDTWNRLIMLKAAEDAGIVVSNDEVADHVFMHPIFQENGQFSLERANQFATIFFDPPGVSIPNGMNKQLFDQAVRNQLKIEKFNKMIQASAVTTDEEVNSLINRLHGASTVKVATLSREDVAKGIEFEELELESFYQQNLARYMTPEKRKIEYVYFQLPADAPAEGNERDDLLRELGEQAFQFSDPFYQAQQNDAPAPDFQQLAKEANLAVLTSDFFEVGGSISGVAGDAKIPSTAFRLKGAVPVSDVIQVEDGFVVIHLTEIQNSEAIPYAEASKRVREDYRSQEIERRLSIEGRQIALKLRDLMDAGAEWDSAAKDAGFKIAEDLSFTPSLEMRNPEAAEANRLAARSVSAMEIGETSPFELAGDTGYVFYVADRTPPPAEIITNNFKSTQDQLVAQQAAMLVHEWVKSQYDAPGTSVKMPREQNL